MTKIVCGHSTSLDGFIAGAGDSSAQPLGIGGARLFQWFRYGVTPSKYYSHFRMSASARGSSTS